MTCPGLTAAIAVFERLRSGEPGAAAGLTIERVPEPGLLTCSEAPVKECEPARRRVLNEMNPEFASLIVAVNVYVQVAPPFVNAMPLGIPPEMATFPEATKPVSPSRPAVDPA